MCTSKYFCTVPEIEAKKYNGISISFIFQLFFECLLCWNFCSFIKYFFIRFKMSKKYFSDEIYSSFIFFSAIFPSDKHPNSRLQKVIRKNEWTPKSVKNKCNAKRDLDLDSCCALFTLRVYTESILSAN